MGNMIRWEPTLWLAPRLFPVALAFDKIAADWTGKEGNCARL